VHAPDEFFKEVDNDKDGTLSLEDFQAFIQGSGQPAQKQ
jgi:hypothetical protein